MIMAIVPYTVYSIGVGIIWAVVFVLVSGFAPTDTANPPTGTRSKENGND